MNKECYLKAIRILTRKDYSIHKLTKKLLDLNFSNDDVSLVINTLVDERFLREDQYIESRVKGFMHKYCSPTFIQQKLSEENCKIEISSIIEIFEEYNYSTSYQIDYLIDKKLRSIKNVDNNTYPKIMRFLLSKGHNYNESKALLLKKLDRYSFDYPL